MICDDSSTVRVALGRMLDTDPGVRVVARAADGQQAVAALGALPPEQRPEVVLLDLEMPVMDGMTALPLLLRTEPRPAVIVASALSQRGAAITMAALRAGAPPGRVQAAAVLVVAVAGLPVDHAAERRVHAERRLRGLHRRAVHLGTQESRHGQRLVADHLGREPEPRAAGQQAVVGVALDKLGTDLRGLLIGGRGHELLHKPFHVPLRGDQLGRQPVEQLRVRRQLPL
jgi:chemotaxis response regulator CheB